MSSTKKLPPSTIIHAGIGIALMLLGHVLPCPSLTVPANDALMAAGFPVADGIAVILPGITFTNFCNSVVLGPVLTPVPLAMCNAFGMNAVPLMACFICAVLIAACTPAASSFAAMLFGNSRRLSAPGRSSSAACPPPSSLQASSSLPAFLWP